MEAMAVSRPVVATDIRGNRDLVQHGVTGFLVPPNKPAELASRLQSLLVDSHLQHMMGRAVRQQVQPYALPLVVEDYASIYRSVGLEIRPRRRHPGSS
jgi:glycosyltransferase involved in cell wall biosynthesis